MKEGQESWVRLTVPEPCAHSLSLFAGVPISLVINSTGLQAPGHLESVELSHSSGKSLLTLPTQFLSNGSTHQLWAGPPFHVPKERFYLKVKGQDHEGNPLLRVSGVSYSGVAPGESSWKPFLARLVWQSFCGQLFPVRCHDESRHDPDITSA